MSLVWTQRTGGFPSLSSFCIAADTSGNAIAAFTSSFLYRSQDGGVTWALRNEPTGAVQKCIAWGKGVFLAGVSGTTNIVVRSIDGGTTWAAVAKPTGWTNNGVDALCYSPTLDKWMAIQNDVAGGKIRYSISSDGGASWAASNTITGTEETLSSGEPVLIWDGTNFVLTGRDSTNLNWIVAYTSDLSNWTIVTGGSIFSGPTDRQCLAYGGGVYLTVGRSTIIQVESKTLAGFASNAGYSMSSLFSGAAQSLAFTPDNGVTWFCGDHAQHVASTTLEPKNAAAWALETISIPASCYITAMCYDVAHQTIIAVGTGAQAICFTAPFANPNAGGATGGGGAGHGARAGQRRLPGFGHYVDLLQRKQLAKPQARRQLKWERHRD